MRLFTVIEKVMMGLDVRRDAQGPFLVQSAYADVLLTLGENTLRCLNSFEWESGTIVLKGAKMAAKARPDS